MKLVAWHETGVLMPEHIAASYERIAAWSSLVHTIECFFAALETLSREPFDFEDFQTELARAELAPWPKTRTSKPQTTKRPRAW